MQSLESIVWKEETWKLSDLKLYDLNPRTISIKQFDALVKDIQDLGYHDRVKINLDGTISSGNQRFRALEKLGYSEAPVLVPSRKLTKKEFERVVIQSNLHRGDWDQDVIANHYDVEDLIEYGAPAEWFPVEDEVSNEEVAVATDKDICSKCGQNIGKIDAPYTIVMNRGVNP